MQRVVRTTLVGLLAIGSLTACGDKVTVPVTPTAIPDNTVKQVTVSPAQLTLNVGDKSTLAASVNAGSGVTNRTVTWTSANAAIATVDANGVVTAVAVGNTTIIAKSAADPTVQAAAAVTVNAAGGGNGATPVVTLSSINQTVCGFGGCNSVPANLAAAAGQLDVILNVDANGATLKSISATLKCGNDVMTRTQNIAAAVVAAEASASPVTLSFNTAEFNNTTGVPTLHNGACTISASAVTTAGTQSAVNTTQLTLANQDGVIVRTTTNGNTATDSIGQAWKSGAVTVSAIPVMYSGATPATVAITLPGAVGPTQTVPAAAIGTATTASWANAAAGANNVAGLTLAGAIDPTTKTRPGDHPTVLITDSNGNALTAIAQVNPVSESDVRLDNQAPTIATATFNANTQNTNAGWVGRNFVFRVGTTAADPINTTYSDLGVAGSSVATQFKNNGAAASTFANFSAPTGLAETSTATGAGSYDLRLNICDKLGNCAQTGVLTAFGVDLTAPTMTPSTTGPANNGIYGIGVAIPNGGTITVAGTDPQGSNGSTGSGFSATPVLVTDTRLAPVGTPTASPNSGTTCTIGTPNAAGTACASAAQQPLTFTATTTNPGQYALTYQVTDQAGNTSATSALSYYLDQAAAPVTTGGVSIPSTVTAGSSFSASSTDDMDIASANGYLQYTTPFNGSAAIRIAQTGTASPVGQAFDNVLTRSSTVTVTLPSTFYRNVGTITGAVITAGVKPDAIGLRAIDAAGNLGTANLAAIPAANVTTPAAAPYTIGTNINGFTLAASPTTVNNGAAGTGTRSTTLTASVAAPSLTATTPFSQICFYVASPNGSEGGQGNAVTKTGSGELSLLGCTSTNVTVDAAGVRNFNYTMSFDPDALYGSAGTLNLVAIGSNAAGDALAAQPVTITLVP